MKQTIEIQFGERIERMISKTTEKYTLEQGIKKIRKNLAKEFGEIPPNISIEVNKKISPLSYGFQIEGWGNIHYQMSEWDFAIEKKEQITEKVLFYFQRFLRKWYMNCYDILIEKKLEKQPLVIEYGEELVDLIETPEFYEKLQSISKKLKLGNISYDFWESEYVSGKEIVLYVYGNDYFSTCMIEKEDIEEIQRHIANEFIEPVLKENAEKLKSVQ